MCRYLLLAIVATLVCCPLVFAKGVSGLQEIYKTPIPDQIRKNFDHAIQAHKQCPECAQRILDGNKYFGIYPKKFIVIIGCKKAVLLRILLSPGIWIEKKGGTINHMKKKIPHFKHEDQERDFGPNTALRITSNGARQKESFSPI